MTRSRWAIFITGVLFVASVALFGVSSAAKADPYPWYNCGVQFETTYKSYYYPQGGYWVAGGPWHDYDAESNWPQGCRDINVEKWNTGDIVVRTVICPVVSGGCYVMQPYNGWGSLNTWTPYGVTLHGYNTPQYENFLFRIETRHFSDPGSGVAENMRLAF